VSYSDKVLTCRDCGAEFTFTTGEQEFFASRGFANEPTRCPTCRASRRSQRGEYGSERSYGSGGGSSGYRSSERTMHPAVCARCGVETQVPFVPRGDRPVYCSSCYSQMRSPSYQ
jgi:CxxC-x17-CxxC domain-containing protein